MAYTVYCHRNLLNGKRYIGITKQKLEYRWGPNGKNYSTHRAFGAAIAKYGWDNFEHIVLDTGLTEEEAKKKEIEYIALWNTTDRNSGYNMTLGGEHRVGNRQPRTPESIEKRRQKMIGRHLSDEHKKKISESLKGKPRQGHTAWNKGLTVDDPRVAAGVAALNEARKNFVPWNKGLTVDDPRVAANIAALQKAMAAKRRVA